MQRDLWANLALVPCPAPHTPCGAQHADRTQSLPL